MNMQIVFSSSATVYGDPEYTPLDEKHRLQVPRQACTYDTSCPEPKRAQRWPRTRSHSGSWCRQNTSHTCCMSNTDSYLFAAAFSIPPRLAGCRRSTRTAARSSSLRTCCGTCSQRSRTGASCCCGTSTPSGRTRQVGSWRIPIMLGTVALVRLLRGRCVCISVWLRQACNPG